jgi:plasmid stability protein
MPSLTLKDIPTPLVEHLRSRAAQYQRSLTHEAIWLSEQALESSADPARRLPQETDARIGAREALSGRWEASKRDTDDLIADIDQSRTQGREITL